MYSWSFSIAGEPEGRGPNPTCFATCANERLPSKPPVVCGAGTSSEVFGARPSAEVVMEGLECASSPLDLQPVTAARTRHVLSKRVKSENRRIVRRKVSSSRLSLWRQPRAACCAALPPGRKHQFQQNKEQP